MTIWSLENNTKRKPDQEEKINACCHHQTKQLCTLFFVASANEFSATCSVFRMRFLLGSFCGLIATVPGTTNVAKTHQMFLRRAITLSSQQGEIYIFQTWLPTRDTSTRYHTHKNLDDDFTCEETTTTSAETQQYCF